MDFAVFSKAVTYVCERGYLPLVDRVKRVPVSEASREALVNEGRSIDELRGITLAKLNRLLASARTAPFYRARNVPRTVASFADYANVLPLEKGDVAAHENVLIAQGYRGPVFRGVTSGSTGVALRFAYSAEHEAWIEACTDRAHRWWGISRGAPRLILWGRPITDSTRAQVRAWLMYRLRNAHSFNTFEELTPAFFERMIATIRTVRPALVYGYGSSIGALASYMDERGIVLDVHERPRLVEYTGDHMFENERLVAERVFGTRVGTLYASSEAGGLSYTCPAGGLHASVDHIHVEYVRDDGTPADPGETAHILATPLHNHAMPLLRYRIGDMGSYSSEMCSCGVTLPLINLDVGKEADRITTSTKKLVSSYVVDYVNKQLLRDGIRGIAQFLVEQVGIDDFVLHVRKENPFDPRSTTFFVERMKHFFGEQVRVDVLFVNEIPMSASGKRRWFKKSIPPVA